MEFITGASAFAGAFLIGRVLYPYLNGNRRRQARSVDERAGYVESRDLRKIERAQRHS